MTLTILTDLCESRMLVVASRLVVLKDEQAARCKQIIIKKPQHLALAFIIVFDF